MPDAPLTIIGSYISPYVRKVLACLDRKGVDYQVDPVVPYYGDDDFGRLSPLRRIPVLLDGDLALSDSTVICEYLDDRYPDGPDLYPRDPADRARARWLEEYADTRMGEVFIWHLFNERVIRRFVWGEETDEAVVAEALEREIPEILDYLEGVLPAKGFGFGEPGVADFAVAAFFRNAAFAGFEIDAPRWPRTAGLVGRVFALPAFERLRPFEELSVRTPIPQHRERLIEAGAPVSPRSVFGEAPRRGVSGR